MRALIAAPLLGLALLGGCAQPKQHLLTERTAAAPAATTSDLRDVAARYTNHPASTARTEIVNLHIHKGFSDAEQAQILAAAREWNHVLNGAVRFDISPTIGGPTPLGAWGIHQGKDTELVPSDLNPASANPTPMSVVQPLPPRGGVIILFVNRMGDHDAREFGGHPMRGVVVHELGVVLGGGKDPTLYTARVDDCIDKNMAMAVGAVRDLPTAQLNWCETTNRVASAR